MLMPERHRVLAGRYELLQEIGAGAMGTVYRARDRRTSRIVAVKVLHPYLARDSSYLERFQREARIAIEIDSRHAVQTLASGQDEDCSFLVMEYIDGVSLSDVLASGYELSERDVLRVAIQIARALEAAAAKGIVHRDIKPDNVLIQPDGMVKVADFGIAKAEAQGGPGTVDLLGTVQYMAPERIAPADFGGVVDTRSDLYALGLLILAMLSERPLFEGLSGGEVLNLHIEGKAGSWVRFRPGASEALIGFAVRCVEREPSARLQNATEARTALEALAPDIQRVEGLDLPLHLVRAGHALGNKSRGLSRIALFAAGAAVAIAAVVALLVVIVLPEGRPPAALAELEPADGTSPSDIDKLKGNLVFEAKLDGVAADFRQPRNISSCTAGPAADPDRSEVRFLPGAVELIIREPNTNTGLTLNTNARSAYVVEYGLKFDPGSQMSFWVSLRAGNSQSIAASLSAASGQTSLVHRDSMSGVQTDLSPRATLPGAQSGQKFTLGAAVDGARYLVFANGRQMLETQDDRLSGIHLPSISAIACGSTGSGKLTLTGARVYELASSAVITSPPLTITFVGKVSPPTISCAPHPMFGERAVYRFTVPGLQALEQFTDNTGRNKPTSGISVDGYGLGEGGFVGWGRNDPTGADFLYICLANSKPAGRYEVRLWLSDGRTASANFDHTD
jgi:predicted Ser/Thr protein kinase